MFKDKPEEMGRLTNDLVSYYQQLAETMQQAIQAISRHAHRRGSNVRDRGRRA